MNPVVDAIVIILFVLLLIYVVAGFNKQQVDKHDKRMDMLDERQKQFEAKQKEKEKEEQENKTKS